MKNIIILLLAVMVTSCQPTGTVTKLGTTNDSIELSRYYYSPGSSVIIARHKSCPHIETVTYPNSNTQESVVTVHKVQDSGLFKNDSIRILGKK